MPAAWRDRVIQARLEAEGIAATVASRSLFDLTGEERDAALDAMVQLGAEPPFVLVGRELACSGELDLDAIVALAKRVSR